MTDSDKMPLALFHRNFPPRQSFSAIKSARTAARCSVHTPHSPCWDCTMSSWFHKLRRKSGAATGAGAGADVGFTRVPVAPAPTPAVMPPWSPNRASYYFPSRERVPAKGNPKLRDTHFPRSPQPGDIVFDVAAGRFGATEALPELKLRPILTRPPAKAGGGHATDSSAAASPTDMVRRRRRLHARRKVAAAPPEEACGRRRRRRRDGPPRRLWLRESLVVVKQSADPEEDFLESMAEMIAADGGVRSPRALEELLACYLALNDAEHHRAIVAAFRRAWLHCVPPPPRGRCVVD
ncbi:hypothetical protein ACP70R_004973 [Stipagrostis hirtigluma subsp. patula]